MDKLVAYFLFASQFGDIGVELALALRQTMFKVESLAYSLVLLEVGCLRQNLAVIVNPAENDVTVRMRLVIMTHHYVRCIGQSHLPHIVMRHFGHKLIRHLGSITGMEVEGYVTYRIFYRLTLP